MSVASQNFAYRQIWITQVTNTVTTVQYYSFSETLIKHPVIKLIQNFSDTSSLKLNLNKCELLPILTCRETHLYNSVVKTKVPLLCCILTMKNAQL